MHHHSVLLREVCDTLQISSGDACCDCTLGLGGHAAAFLHSSAPQGILFGIDADERNLREAKNVLQPYGNRIHLVYANFRDLPSILPSPVDVIFADLGLSSPHLDDASRGFSFRFSGPLDLRFDRSTGVPASQWIADAEVHTLAKIFSLYGELHRALRLAHAIKECSPQTTDALLHCMERVYHWKAKALAPQVFQALRIAVNDELSALEALLQAVPALLKPGGRCGIIAFHSLEDRIVKHAFRSWSMPTLDPSTGQILAEAPFTLLTKRPVVATEEEVRLHPRSRSAKFRAVQKR